MKNKFLFPAKRCVIRFKSVMNIIRPSNFYFLNLPRILNDIYTRFLVFFSLFYLFCYYFQVLNNFQLYHVFVFVFGVSDLTFIEILILNISPCNRQYELSILSVVFIKMFFVRLNGRHKNLFHLYP